MATIGTLEAIAVLCLLADDIKNCIDEFGPFRIVALGPVVAGTVLAEHKVVGAEDLAVGPGAEAVHRAGLQVHEHGAGDVPSPARLVVIDVHTLELEVGGADVVPGRVDPVLVTDHLPELAADLVAALAGLNVEDLSHFF